MTRLDPDQLADRIEREIRDGAFILLGPAEVALCAQALRHYAVPYSKQPMSTEAYEAFCKKAVDTQQIHPRLAEVLSSYGATGIANKADE